MTSFDGRMASSFSSIPPHVQYQPPNHMAQPAPPAKTVGPVNGGVRTGATRQNPQIYTAVYSGVAVYEMELNAVAVMRRRSDSWLNATQILKVAGVDKGKRTKILEKEILTGHHEKVQGGYGRYQGTWISYDRGREFCRAYGVEDILRPLLDYDIISDGSGTAGKADTPTKEQAMAAQRKRLYNSSMDNRVNGQASNGTFFQNISPTASNALAAMNKAARFESPLPRPGSSAQRRPVNVMRQPSQNFVNSQDSAGPASQGSVNSFNNDPGLEGSSHFDSGFGNVRAPVLDSSMLDAQEPPRKKIRSSFSHENAIQVDPALRDGTPTEPNESFLYPQNAMDVDPGTIGLPPMFPSGDREDETKRLTLLELFADITRTDYSNHPAIINLYGKDLDIPLDATANTALHWAATLARVPLLRLLIQKGANTIQGNAANQTPLMSAVQVNNTFDHGCFPEMLESLGPLIDVRDSMGRTVLHHVAVSSGIKGRSQSSRYYLESLLEYVVRQGSSQSQGQSTPGSQLSSFTGISNGAAASKLKPMNLGRFMSEVVNVQDKSGNTALNLAARIGNRTIINQLEEVGADFEVPNNAGFRPTDFGVFPRNQGPNQHSSSQGLDSSQGQSPSQMEQIREEIFATTQSILAQTQSQYSTELSKKQNLIDQQNAELRNIARQHQEEVVKLNALQYRAREASTRQRKIVNLRNTIAEQQLKAKRQDNASLKDSGHPIQRIDTQRLPSNLPNGDSQDVFATPDAESYLHSLPSAVDLKAQIAALSSNKESLESRLSGLKGRSLEVEAQYRKIVSLCTGMDEDRVDSMLDGLVAAIESEGNERIDMGRVRDFLRKVEGADG